MDQLDSGLVELEKDPYSQDLLGSIFRAIHTVKGTSGVLGFPKLEAIAHAGENLLSKLRDGKLHLSTEITSGLLKMVDAIREILRAIEASGMEGANDYTSVSSMLNDLVEQEMAKAEKESSTQSKLLGERSQFCDAARNEASESQLTFNLHFASIATVLVHVFTPPKDTRHAGADLYPPQRITANRQKH